MYKFLVLLVVLGIAQANNHAQRCRFNSGNLPTATRVEGCRGPPCTLPQLRNISIRMLFTAPRDIPTNARTVATVYRGGASPQNFDLGGASRTCNSVSPRCPIRRNVQVDYNLRASTGFNLPFGTSGTVEFRVLDGSNPVICISLPFNIQVRSGAYEDNEETNNVVDELPTDV